MTDFFTKIVKKILLEATENLPEELPYGFWINRGGDFIKVPYQAHGTIALKIISKNPIYKEEFSKNISQFTDYSASQIMAVQFLLNKGYIKTEKELSAVPPKIYYTSKVQPTHKQLSILHTMAITYGADLLRG